ncbi:hypothetical protein [Rhizobium sp. CECT 9324]|uniref:hypothetical protein n=1 Tax=Rhizobium sp. CECT 9324 TaxID=2845820 RepID=UPI001E45138D|nr:hypothetical protein [Rhizobium sp. CECT 9324]
MTTSAATFSRGSRPVSRFSASRPPATLWFFGAIAWGLAMAGCFTLSVHLLGRSGGSHQPLLAFIYGAGGALAWLTALPIIRVAAFGRQSETVLAAWFLFLGMGTIAVTAGLFALQYRIFYAQWHAPFLSRVWFLQQIFTSASALYQFAVLGLRHFLPFAFLLLFVVSLAMSRRNR